ncbi:hypothetical protein [Blastococcus sp. Marseille-P5729]|uniref:hypothetical protein n=1 Tax=Blastococcus sp. Marseille-P5729 TaxID=2086582 RepID=UPI000D107284|nr:hypothetical protein [Blastococcus sp. Marseille-P5729]
MQSKQMLAVTLTFIIAAVALTFAFMQFFDSAAIAIGPAIAVAVGIAAAVYFAMRDKQGSATGDQREMRR